jgi:hypothetical protein
MPERLKCIYCNENICASSSWGYDEMGYEGDGIVTIYNCQNDECDVDDIYVHQPIKIE